ncbi:MAG: hypothetical protein PHW18_01800 [Sulfuricurvum sp.]|uniref:hypothetical protein n=1 Tax=Sulfuricurvum sp. TaxID=2025608 RepID=UPI0026357978|nr:hypothetical protein [Sulfuricurvum sp.]MDD2828289.1 hypothetical protein [Sulfuricurvum sp.]MDD4949756.1 hypothetical protein [Sulfuricurvum sp.]
MEGFHSSIVKLVPGGRLAVASVLKAEKSHSSVFSGDNLSRKKYVQTRPPTLKNDYGCDSMYM